MSKTKQNNGVSNVLTPSMEQMRQEVVAIELRARFAKADFEVMYYTLEAEKLVPDFQDYIKRKQNLQTKAQEQIQQLVEGIQKEEAPTLVETEENKGI